jgi:predicted nucleic acid-binding protein
VLYVVLVDSSVWIDHINRVVTEPVSRLRELFSTAEILIGDLILCEVLQGARDERTARRWEAMFRDFERASLSDSELAIKAAGNYRLLRRRGITVRKTIDVIIGTFCIERGHVLLHDDRDFEPMERFLGLETV